MNFDLRKKRGGRRDRTIVRLQKVRDVYYIAVPKWAVNRLGAQAGDRFRLDASQKALFYDWVGVDND